MADMELATLRTLPKYLDTLKWRCGRRAALPGSPMTAARSWPAQVRVNGRRLRLYGATLLGDFYGEELVFVQFRGQLGWHAGLLLPVDVYNGARPAAPVAFWSARTERSLDAGLGRALVAFRDLARERQVEAAPA